MKNKHYRNFAFIIGVMLCASCVDNYTTFNPPAKKDAPAFMVSVPGSNSQVLVAVPKNAYQNDYKAYVKYTTPVEFTVSVIKAAGKIGSISVTPSVPEFGTVTINESSVAAVQGQESGDFKFTFTPNSTLPAQNTDRTLNLVVSVSDSQTDAKGEPEPKTSSMTIATTLISPCVSEGIVPGNYIVAEASGNIDGNVPFVLSDLEEGMASKIVVVITEDRPGVYSFNEVTAGVWPLFYSGRANPKLKVDLCGNTITGRSGAVTAGAGTATARTFTLNGTLNDNGTITMTWSYKRDIGATPAGPAKGTYTLKRIAVN